MLKYKSFLRQPASKLRNELTDSERLLWSKVRKKQILGVQFYRQKPIGRYIVDFYASKPKLVIEIDGSQHLEENHQFTDSARDAYLGEQGLRVLRFNSREVLKNIDQVMEVIFKNTKERIV